MTSEVLEIPAGNEMFDGYRAAFEKYGFSPAVKSKGFLYISGQVGTRPDGTAPESIADQTTWAFKRVEELLRIAGLDFSDLVDVTSYHVDIENTLPDFLEVKKHFIKSPYPAWSIIGISGLSRPELKVEIQVVASLRD
ncbi:RidA family protein [Thalassospira sp.]|uniref:RidA family protein n=1 Tax=Thalassospira sp. TaxID=1912094 RepID=UPI0025F28284|nr:RidA family protein [Thalassospira sp.]|tara:strand:- start:9839 stop:10252 length:414 start_codon:yes stop_codon:yes gene_type:complete